MTDSDTDAASSYEVAVVGGGPAGLTAALYTTRLGHDTVVFDRGGGRAAMMQDTHNVIGVTEDVSGQEFLATAEEQVERYGADVRRAFVEDAAVVEDDAAGGGAGDAADDRRFRLETTAGATVAADRVVLATGFSDERPDPPLPRTGRGLHYCLHCDAYTFVDEPVFVMGVGDAAVHVAAIMLNFTADVDLLLDGAEPAWGDDADRLLRAHPVDVVESEVSGVENRDDGWLEALEFADGTRREYAGGFPMYGSDYNADLADALGVERNDDGTVAVDDDGRTSVDGAYAVGDLTPGHNQVPVAMGEGANAGIAIHTELRTFPMNPDDVEAGAVADVEVPATSDRLRRVARKHPGHAGGPVEE